ncbi:DUF1858 domain-containing protein [Anaeromonas gelatinilytica]|uniref:DUF1858 domain-containing protein n=1 Tax=Anaeromonas gelatinilytica TaxID=2683194 RepID=UPI002078BAD8
MAITKDMLIGEIIKERSDAPEILMGFGMGCIGCPSSQMETLEQAAMVHGLPLEDLLEALNK